MKENISPVVIAVIVILVIAIVAFFGVRTFAPSRNTNPSADQIKAHMGAGIPQSGGSSSRRGSPDSSSGSPTSSGSH